MFSPEKVGTALKSGQSRNAVNKWDLPSRIEIDHLFLVGDRFILTFVFCLFSHTAFFQMQIHHRTYYKSITVFFKIVLRIVTFQDVNDHGTLRLLISSRSQQCLSLYNPSLPITTNFCNKFIRYVTLYFHAPLLTFSMSCQY